VANLASSGETLDEVIAAGDSPAHPTNRLHCARPVHWAVPPRQANTAAGDTAELFVARWVYLHRADRSSYLRGAVEAPQTARDGRTPYINSDDSKIRAGHAEAIEMNRWRGQLLA